ncbi:MAG: TetR/AcrR family transcriptional regulator [Velocimicrobium sp.]
MNQGFFSLHEDKQRKIINMGFQVFSQSTYKKAPVAEIAARAGISKSLLFYHFKNKKEFYLFLWKKSIELTRIAMKEQDVLGTNNYFEMLRRSLIGKCNLLRKYPYVSEFSLRAYYEENIEVRNEIQDSFWRINLKSEKRAFEVIDIGMLRDDIDIHQMYQEMVWASDGYLHMAFMQGNINVDKIKLDFEKLILMWEKVYQK